MINKGIQVQQVGNRGCLFTYEDNISVYLIHTKEKWFLCDTHLGPVSMDCVKQYISAQSIEKEIIIFNSHSDWDHIWGNCAFQAAIIIGHETCRTRLAEIGQFELASLSEYHSGDIKLVLPNVTFSDKMIFEEAAIEFVYAPGHTIDSAICFDREDSVLFVGDLVEDPIPYLDFDDLEAYIRTLEFIKGFPAMVKISSHSGIIDNKLIESNITYIKGVLHNNTDPSVYQKCPTVHNFNVNNRLVLKHEKMIREKLGVAFDYALFRSKFGDLSIMSYKDLQEALASIMED